MKSNYVAKTLAVVAALVFSLATFANDGSKKANLKDDQVSVQYVGSSDNQVVFHVEFENPTAEKFWLIIKNDAGDVVYRKQFSDAHFSKSVYVLKEDTEIRPTFIIRNSNNEVVRKFSVSNVVTENTVVTKL
ncbi:MAG TPA: hypothetical protein VHD83_20300 [Puia sp.]|nr:hypothetical protein [Puia sp.]